MKRLLILILIFFTINLSKTVNFISTIKNKNYTLALILEKNIIQAIDNFSMNVSFNSLYINKNK
jgi:hypothetical protein